MRALIFAAAITLGMVINGAPRHTQRYGYGQGYYSYYYYGDKPMSAKPEEPSELSKT